jgi:hypothetical protein
MKAMMQTDDLDNQLENALDQSDMLQRELMN